MRYPWIKSAVVLVSAFEGALILLAIKQGQPWNYYLQPTWVYALIVLLNAWSVDITNLMRARARVKVANLESQVAMLKRQLDCKAAIDLRRASGAKTRRLNSILDGRSL